MNPGLRSRTFCRYAVLPGGGSHLTRDASLVPELDIERRNVGDESLLREARHDEASCALAHFDTQRTVLDQVRERRRESFGVIASGPEAVFPHPEPRAVLDAPAEKIHDS